MPETASRTSSTANSRPCDQFSLPSALRLKPTTTSSALPHRVDSRIGVGLAGGFYPAPHRYELYLSRSCPFSLRIAITLGLLGLRDSVATTLLADPARTPDAFASLRRAYEATEHHFDGPLTAPALCDRWSGRIVSNHPPAILRDLAGLLSGHTTTCPSTLRPPSLTADIEALRDLLDRDVTPSAAPSELAAALDLLDCQLAGRTYVLGDSLTAADVDAWTALTGLGRSRALGSRPRLLEYVRRLGDHPAFRHAHDVVPLATEV
ncbi:glutathione S-transferase C-terminal domain-containing protein [Streptomyces sp. NPDC059371]|uniref:glutathione S-transferase C-terminal domain-containing protein n=1 Tax=Streptomyces sp. NPDC059371 TaxID=3346812 RepID=UPI0036C5C1A3